MKSKQTLRLLTLAGLSSLIASTALAQESGYFYGGVSAGEAQSQIAQEQIAASLLGAGGVASRFSRDERDSSYKVFGGYQFSRNFGVEIGYFSLGRFGFNAVTTPPGTVFAEIKPDGINVDLVGTAPLSENWSLLGRLGAQYSNTHAAYGSTGIAALANRSNDDRKTDYKVGVGLQYAFTPSVSMRAEIERYRMDDGFNSTAFVNVASVGLVYAFGRTATPAPRGMPVSTYREPEPTPVVVAPAPVMAAAPVVMAPPPRQRVNFSADSLFSFDRSEVNEQGKLALDGFVRELRGTQFNQITIQGHTDRLGSEAYNQTLSEQRAQAVKAYLVSNGGLDGSKILAEGKGESMPLTKTEDCKGKTASPRLILCLQPDRRVDVEVNALK